MFLSLVKIRTEIIEEITDGYPRKDVYMIWVNSIDLKELLSSISEFADLPEIPNKCRIFGIEIVGHPHLQQGTMAKFFKDIDLDKHI